MQDLINLWPVLAALLVTGACAGILSGLLGVGGGIVIVPVLYFLLQHFDVSSKSAMAIAVATSLATIIPTAISSSLAHYRKGNVDLDILKRWSLFIVVFAVIGSLIGSHINAHYLKGLFALVAIAVALNMLLRAGAPALFPSLPGTPGQGVLASLVGGVSVMVGIGGGTLGVPMLNAFNVPAHRAVGTASAFGLIIALPGTITLLLVGVAPADAPYGNLGPISLPAFVAIVPLTVVFAPLGAKIAARLNQKNLKKAFALVLCATGVRMLLSL